MEALSCRHDPILTPPLAFSPLPEGWRDGSSNPLTMPWSFWGPVGILKLCTLLQPTVTSWTYKTLITQEMPRVLYALVSGTKVKDQIWEQKMLLAPRCLKWILGALCQEPRPRSNVYFLWWHRWEGAEASVSVVTELERQYMLSWKCLLSLGKGFIDISLKM